MAEGAVPHRMAPPATTRRRPASSQDELDADAAARQALSTGTPDLGAWDPARDRPDAGVPARPAGSASGGQPLPGGLRAFYGARFGVDFSSVRVHTDDAAAARADRLGADAYTVGRDIAFGPGRFRPGTSWGQELLSHELAHVVQQSPHGGHGLGSLVPRVAGPVIQRRPKTAPGSPARKTRTITRITLFVDRGIVVLELDGKDTLTLPVVWNGRPPVGNYAVHGHKASPPIGGVANGKGFVTEWVNPPDAIYRKGADYTFSVIAGRPGPTSEAGQDPSDGTRAGKDDTSGDQSKGAKDTTGHAKKGDEKKKGEDGEGGKDGRGVGDGTSDTQTGQAGGDDRGADGGMPRLTPAEEVVWRQIAALMKGAGQQSGENPAELVRLFQVLRSLVANPTFGSEGESWIRFARFLDKNRDKIEGYFAKGPKGKITTEALEKIITEYGRFLGRTKDEDRPGALERDEEFDKEFRYDPGWANLSPADRHLLLEYARLSPGEIRDKKVDFTSVTGDMKRMMALKLADTTLLGEMADAAKTAFTDPTFLVTLFVVTGIYVVLWLAPDPSWVSKLLASALTVALLTQFAIQDIYGFAVAWSDFGDECVKATTIAELKQAGDTFLKRLGPIGFDIMLFLVMWRIGKLAGPKLSRIGAERGVVRAKANVAAIEAEPGSKIAQPRGPEGDLLKAAKGSSKGTTPTQVLDALAELLGDQGAKDGLAKFRAKAGDAAVLRSMEGQSARGANLGKYLTEQGLSPQAVADVKLRLDTARIRLARAKLIQAETIKDPAVRQTVREEQFRAIRALLQEVGALDGQPIKDALAARDVTGLMRALRAVLDSLGETTTAKETQGALGEALQRINLQVKYAGRAGIRILSNLALVRRVGQFRSIGEWVASEQARIRAEKPGIRPEQLAEEVAETRVKLLEKDGRVYLSLGEFDAMVTEPSAVKGLQRPVEVSEVKGGGAATPVDAAAQLADAVGELSSMSSGGSTTRVFEMTGKKTLGRDITSTLDLSGASGIVQTTAGPAGRGFTTSLGFTEPELKGVAESLIRNLPPDKPATIPPLTSPREDDAGTPSR